MMDNKTGRLMFEMENPDDPAPPGARKVNVFGGGGRRAAERIKAGNHNIPDRDAWREAGAGVTFRRVSRKVGRNEMCPCGSGKKFKACHDTGGRWDVLDMERRAKDLASEAMPVPFTLEQAAEFRDALTAGENPHDARARIQGVDRATAKRRNIAETYAAPPKLAVDPAAPGADRSAMARLTPEGFVETIPGTLEPTPATMDEIRDAAKRVADLIERDPDALLAEDFNDNAELRAAATQASANGEPISISPDENPGGPIEISVKWEEREG